MQFLLINANCSLDLRRVSKEKRKKWSMGKQRGCLRGKENILGELRKHKRKEKEFREVDSHLHHTFTLQGVEISLGPCIHIF